ncbi:hypothetical protein VTK73DRAFT_47 [Phialemonium thermophilum]|uniref:Cytokinesis regulator n=1 Tax=Phialemonium thermophilum TaxID=223376 RepID=A0ABR3Y987_9PEZI
MDALRLKPRQPVEEDVENWDDDDFVIEGDDLTFQSQSTSGNAQSHRRDSHSSFRSEFESVHGEEEKQVLLPGDDEKSTLDAIAAAAKAGIPIPSNVPPSALMGGTIKRLGGRKIRKIIQEDWGDDLEIPDPSQGLTIKPQDSSRFPDAIRQVSSSTHASPSKSAQTSNSAFTVEDLAPKSRAPSIAVDLDRFRDTEDDDDFFGVGDDTIKVPKHRQAARPISLITPPTPKKRDVQDEDFEKDFELPFDGKLKLSRRKDIPKTPSSHTVDDFDWGEGSLGTRFGGTRRGGRSNRSSSVSALSPSISSSFTVESEDEALDGLVLPDGPVNLVERLSRRQQSCSPERAVEGQNPDLPIGAKPQALPTPDKDDLLSGLEIGDGEVFDSKKLTLHRNIQVKETQPASPSRPRTAVALKFTSKPPAASRLPRPLGLAAGHERSHTQSSLEPVSESGGPISHSRRSLSRLGHSTQSSVSSLQTPTTPLSAQSLPPSTPRRREVGQKTSTVSLRDGPTTTSAQLLRLKRSLPVMRPGQSPASRPLPTARGGYDRPASRTDMASRPQSALRPKTPVDRPRTVESAAALARKPPVPFLPAGASVSQSHNINAKSSRVFRRHDSENGIDFRPNSRAVSRSTMRSPSPRKARNVEKLAHEGVWQQLSKPRRVRHFGDGHELDGFDDLPTSSQNEARFIRQPVASGPKTQLRNRLYQNILPDRTNTPSPLSPYSTSKLDYVPSFARDTAASRIARETSLAQRTPSGGPLAPLTTQRVAQLSTKSNLNPYTSQPDAKSRKLRRPPQLKPHLISNLNPPKESRMVNGMFYNPETFRWEGNDNALSAFDPPASSPSTASIPQPFVAREKENATPRPALITNIGTTKGVQVVGGMVFDPQNMCWLKLGPQRGKSDEADSIDGLNGISDEEDVFKDIPDLEDHTADSSEGGQGRVSDIKDDWLVGEEFDVGPEFVRRQREEEDRWRRKCERWMVGSGQRDLHAWKWAIREIVNASIKD